jgi:hypothetical protein
MTGATLTNTHDVELEPSLQKLLLDLLRDAVKPDMRPRKNRISLRHCHRHGDTRSDRKHRTWVRAKEKENRQQVLVRKGE